jgi:hypothetical protein
MGFENSIPPGPPVPDPTIPPQPEFPPEQPIDPDAPGPDPGLPRFPPPEPTGPGFPPPSQVKRVYLILAAVVLCLGVATVLLAQTNPQIGTWKLNSAKSQYESGPVPKNLTRKVEQQGDSLKYTYEGVAADGTPIAYSFVLKFDGNDYPVTGSGLPDGADTLAFEGINSRTSEATLKRAGKVVGTTRTVVSADGKVTTLHYQSIDRLRTRVAVFEKQ